MIQIELGIRYLSQLKRTRPNDIGRFESKVTGVLKDSGAALRRESGILIAVFNERSLAFWIDLAIALEGIADSLSLVEKELLGRSCVVRCDPDPSIDSAGLCRSLSNQENQTGVWCDAKVAAALSEYAVFREAEDYFALVRFSLRNKNRRGYRDWKIREDLAETLYSLHLSDAAHPRCAIAVEGAPSLGKRQTLAAVFDHLSPCVSVLRVSFFGQGQGFSSIADCVAEERLKEIGADDPSAEAALRAQFGSVRAIKAFRLSMEIPSAPRAAFSSFFSAFIGAWVSAVEKQRIPVFVVENAHLADSYSRALLRAVFAEQVSQGRSHLVAAGTGDEAFHELFVGRFRILRVEPPRSDEWKPLIDSVRAEYGMPQADSDLVDRCVAEAAANGISSGFRRAIGWRQTAAGIPQEPHPHLTNDLLEVAYTVALFSELFPPDELYAAFSSMSKPREVLPLALTHLAELGLIEDAGDPRPACRGLADFAEKLLGERGKEIRELVRNRLLEAIKSKRLYNSYEASVRLVALGGSPDLNQILDAVVDGVLRGESEAVESALRDGSFLRTVGTEAAESLSDIFRSRKALVSGDENQVREVFSSPQPTSFPHFRYQAYSLLDRASFAFSSDQLDSASTSQAADAAKRALLLLQDSPSSKGLSRAYRLLGETALSRELISEAVDYFSFSAESSERSDEPYEALLASVNGSCTQFLLGNISKSERCALDAERSARDLYQDEWLCWARFMRARVQFEIGSYSLAAQSFSVLAGQNETVPLFRSWRDRALAYSDSAIGPSFTDQTDDSMLFRVEAAFLRGAYEEAVREADAYLSLPVASRIRNPERVDWSSGFSLIEDRAIGRKDSSRVVRRLVRVFRAYALSKIDRADESVAELQRIVKEEPISDLDPYDSFYFWTLSVALKTAGASAVDSGTMLSIAFKRLQRRASRIDDPESKRSYVSANRWNKALYADAKAVYLI